MLKIKPKKRIFKKIYLSILMLFLAKRFKAISFEKKIKEDIKDLPDNFCFCIKIENFKPQIIVKKVKNKFKILNPNNYKDKIDLYIIFKNIERAFSVFSFKISAFLCYAQNGLIVKGNLPETMIIMRILTLLEIYLLPKFIIKNVIKRYPKFNFFIKIFKRCLIYFKILLGI